MGMRSDFATSTDWRWMGFLRRAETKEEDREEEDGEFFEIDFCPAAPTSSGECFWCCLFATARASSSQLSGGGDGGPRGYFLSGEGGGVGLEVARGWDRRGGRYRRPSSAKGARISCPVHSAHVRRRYVYVEMNATRCVFSLSRLRRRIRYYVKGEAT